MMGKMQGSDQDLNKLKNMDCSCKFKRLFVNTVNQPIHQLQEFNRIVDKHTHTDIHIPKKALKIVKKIIKKKIDDAISDDQDKRILADDIKKIRSILKHPK